MFSSTSVTAIRAITKLLSYGDAILVSRIRDGARRKSTGIGENMRGAE